MIQTMKKYIFLFSFLFPVVLNGMNYGIGDTLNVVAMDGLVIRSGPGTYAERIGVLMTYDRIIVVDTSNFHFQSDSIFGFRGNWIKIRSFDGIKGFVFDAFLSTLPIVDQNRTNINEFPNGIKKVSSWLTSNLKDYVKYNFKHSISRMTSVNEDNPKNNQIEYLDVDKFEGAHLFFDEYNGCEYRYFQLELSNVRISEVYYLIMQFLPIDKAKWPFFNEAALKSPDDNSKNKNCILMEYSTLEFADGVCVGDLLNEPQIDGFILVFSIRY